MEELKVPHLPPINYWMDFFFLLWVLDHLLHFKWRSGDTFHATSWDCKSFFFGYDCQHKGNSSICALWIHTAPPRLSFNEMEKSRSGGFNKPRLSIQTEASLTFGLTIEIRLQQSPGFMEILPDWKKLLKVVPPLICTGILRRRKLGDWIYISSLCQ